MYWTTNYSSLWSFFTIVVTINTRKKACWSLCGKSISVPNRQNPFPLVLVKLRYRALKFLVHFNLVLGTKVPQMHTKVVTQKG